MIRMNRPTAFVALLAIGGVSVTLQAVRQSQPDRTLAVEKLRDNLYILKTIDPANESGGNTAVFIRSDGVTLVDTKNPGWGASILTRVKELTSKPVTMIVNTHSHGDHVSGSVEIPGTVDVVTHVNAQGRMKGAGIFQRNSGRGLPTRTFTDQLTIGSGADAITLRYFGRGHTDGDAWVVFPALGAVHAGDMFARKGLMFMDGTNGGSGVDAPETLAKAAAGLANVDSIITGHSTVMTVADLKEYAEFIREFVTTVRDAKRAGQTIDQIEAGWAIPAKYKGYNPIRDRVRGDIELLFKELP